MPSTQLLAAALSLSILLSAAPATAAMRVVSTVTDLAALAREVGGEHVTVSALVVAGEDPHFVDARPSLILPLSKADLLLVVGLDLEVGWLPALQAVARNPAIQTGAPGYFDASHHIQPLRVPNGSVSRSMGDVHPGGNPHFLLDPRAGAAVAQAMGKAMAARDPEHAAHYQKNAEKLAAQLRHLATKAKRTITALPPDQRRVVAYHDSLPYLNDWLGLQQVATIEPRPGVPPNPAHVSRVLRVMRRTGARVILQEDYYPRTTSKTLAKLAKATVLPLETATHINKGERYVDHIAHVAREVQNALAR